MKDNTLVISNNSLTFFLDWNKIEKKLRRAVFSFKLSQQALKEIGLSLFEILNLYTNRFASFIVYEAYIDSNLEPNYELMIASELFDIIVFHLLDDIIDNDKDFYTSYYGEPKIIAFSLPIIFEIIYKFPFFSKFSKFYVYDYKKPKSLKEYLDKITYISYFPLEIMLDYINSSDQIRSFWNKVSLYLKILDDIKDNDAYFEKDALFGLIEKYEKEIVSNANTFLQKKFANYITNPKIHSILENISTSFLLIR